VKIGDLVDLATSQGIEAVAPTEDPCAWRFQRPGEDWAVWAIVRGEDETAVHRAYEQLLERGMLSVRPVRLSTRKRARILYLFKNRFRRVVARWSSRW